MGWRGRGALDAADAAVRVEGGGVRGREEAEALAAAEQAVQVVVVVVVQARGGARRGVGAAEPQVDALRHERRQQRRPQREAAGEAGERRRHELLAAAADLGQLLRRQVEARGASRHLSQQRSKAHPLLVAPAKRLAVRAHLDLQLAVAGRALERGVVVEDGHGLGLQPSADDHRRPHRHKALKEVLRLNRTLQLRNARKHAHARVPVARRALRDASAACAIAPPPDWEWEALPERSWHQPAARVRPRSSAQRSGLWRRLHRQGSSLCSCAGFLARLLLVPHHLGKMPRPRAAAGGRSRRSISIPETAYYSDRRVGGPCSSQGRWERLARENIESTERTTRCVRMLRIPAFIQCDTHPHTALAHANLRSGTA